ncbi:hypothetical protein B0T11DRAFT_49834 [Plectosphaerella cucumerina]|uniref:Uncharacterized protein n=1 Tax=Plectosphaerella cucumerina TaxID=40658 RepID=A0A8K0TP98_9PEZI|nr:hypothetical protein B0T11DRAFT_49834 [Plectosphaerella cucumerina]
MPSHLGRALRWRNAARTGEMEARFGARARTKTKPDQTKTKQMLPSPARTRWVSTFRAVMERENPRKKHRLECRDPMGCHPRRKLRAGVGCVIPACQGRRPGVHLRSAGWGQRGSNRRFGPCGATSSSKQNWGSDMGPHRPFDPSIRTLERCVCVCV